MFHWCQPRAVYYQCPFNDWCYVIYTNPCFLYARGSALSSRPATVAINIKPIHRIDDKLCEEPQWSVVEFDLGVAYKRDMSFGDIASQLLPNTNAIQIIDGDRSYRANLRYFPPSQ